MPEPGEVFDGRYRIDACVGEGAVGAVYRAIEVATDRPVALKVLHARLVDVDWLRERFDREARALGQLRHPGIVPVLGHGLAESGPYLAMALLEGRTLADLLRAEGPLSVERACALGLQILEAAAFAHAQGVIHRDLSAGNVFVAGAGPDERTRILDFGLVKLHGERWGPQASLTNEGEVFGTPAYMPPEQGVGGEIAASSDVYSLGVLLFELLAGRRPFTQESLPALRRAHLVDTPPRLWETRSELAGRHALDAVVQKALAKRPADRFPDAGALLRAFLDASDERPPAKPGRAVARWIAIAVGVLLAAGAAMALAI